MTSIYDKPAPTHATIVNDARRIVGQLESLVKNVALIGESEHLKPADIHEICYKLNELCLATDKPNLCHICEREVIAGYIDTTGNDLHECVDCMSPYTKIVVANPHITTLDLAERGSKKVYLCPCGATKRSKLYYCDNCQIAR